MKDIRKLILRLLGVNRENSPKAFLEFLNSTPCGDAYTDFEAWAGSSRRSLEESL